MRCRARHSRASRGPSTSMSATCEPRSRPIPPSRNTSRPSSASATASRANKMSRSITLRLILAFLLVGITVVALASGITSWLTVREFRQFTYDTARDRFLAEMTFYYQTHGSWDGVLSYYQERSQVRTPFNPGPDFPAPGNGGQPGPQRLVFALADQGGRVLIP